MPSLAFSFARPFGSWSAIARLFGAGCPSHVARFVIAVVVDPINRQFRRWPAAHITKELRKTGTPFRADRDPAAAVIPERPVFWIVASAQHARPDHEFLGFRLVSPGIAMKFSGAPSLTPRASARGRFAIPQIAAKYMIRLTAIAATQPVRTLSPRQLGAIQYGPTAESLSGQVNQSHDISYVMLHGFVNA